PGLAAAAARTGSGRLRSSPAGLGHKRGPRGNRLARAPSVPAGREFVMKILGIDTHGPVGGAALVAGGQLLSQVHLSVRATHSEQLLPTIELVLAEAMARRDGRPPVDAI